MAICVGILFWMDHPPKPLVHRRKRVYTHLVGRDCVYRYFCRGQNPRHVYLFSNSTVDVLDFCVTTFSARHLLFRGRGYANQIKNRFLILWAVVIGPKRKQKLLLSDFNRLRCLFRSGAGLALAFHSLKPTVWPEQSSKKKLFCGFNV